MPRVQARRALEVDLRAALRRTASFEVHYQPLVDLATGEVTGVRGADPLAASRARPDPAGGVHPDRRGDRPDRAARRLGAAAGLRRGGALAGRRQGRGQPVAAAVPQRQRCCSRCVEALGDVGLAAAAARARDHRGRAAATRASRHRDAARAARARRRASRWTTSAPAIRR